MTEEWRAQRPKKPRDGPRTEYTAADWLLQMKLADKRNEKWERRCKKIIKRYRNQHLDDGNEGAKDRRGMNVLWSNVETLSPSIYGREPVPICERRFLDKDIVGRVAAQILERALRYEMGDCGFHDCVEQNIKDYLLVGRGVPWLRYKPVIGQATSIADRGDDDLSGQDGTEGEERTDDADDPDDAEDRDGDEPTDETPQEKFLAAGLEIDYVHWTDFFTSNARFWKENEWVARRFFPSRNDLCDDFGDEIGKAVPLEMAPDHEEMRDGGRAIEEAPDSQRKAIAWEIWHRPTRKVYTVAKGFDKYLEDPRDDPLNLDKFYPCPKPLFATMTNDTLEPVADYLEYQDQALQIDDLTNRISLLTKALKVSGLYDAANKDLARLLDEGNENKMVPVANWAQLSAKGGLEAAVTFMPIKEIAETLEGLVAARDKVKQDMFEITGLADIIRGQSDPRETAAAVNTKGRWGSLRLQARQAAVARFCRDIIAMMGEVIAEHYTPEMLINISGAMYDEGIGGPAPEKPQKPDLPAPGMPPGIGHNGVGGPLLGSTPMGAVLAAGIPVARPPVGAPLPGPGGIPNHPMVGPIGPQPAPPQPGMLHAGPPAPMAPGMAPPQPPLPPQLQYDLAMQQWQAQMQEHLIEKQTIIMKAITLLKEDKMRGFRIDIETDSTVQQDAQEDKQARTEFIAATTKFVEQAFQIGAQAPDAVPMLGKMLLFGVRGFRAGRDLESSIEEFVDKMEGDAKKRQSAPPPPNPELQKQQLELQGIQAKSQAEVQKAQTDAAASAADNQREMASKAADAQNAQAQNAMQMEEMRQKAAYEAQANAFKLRELELKMRATEQDHSHTVAQMHAAHAQKMGELGAKIDNPEGPPMEGARRAPDGNFYVQHPTTKQFYRVDKKKAA